MTPAPDPRSLIGAYATGSLTRTERELLMRAALEDDSLFALLAEADDWREALADEDFRQTVLARLRATSEPIRPSWRDRLAAVFPKPWLTGAAAAAGIVVILLVRSGYLSESSPAARIALGDAGLAALHSADLLQTPTPAERALESSSRADPPPAARDAALALDRAGSNPAYRIGDRQRIGFTLPERASVLLAEELPDGSAVRLFPNRFQESPSVQPNQTVRVPPDGQGDRQVEGPPGQRVIRLLVFPPDIDPLAPGLAWEGLKAQARVVERRYRVNP